jgi:6-phosphogluconolactonase (cycloisomerase 2 family)
MNRSLQLLAWLSAALCTNAVCAQTVAYVYVANNPKNSSTNEIAAYAASADGKLKPIFGSPFRENVTALAVTGKYLVAANRSEPVIDTFTIESDGALHYATSTNYAKHTSTQECADAGQLFFDHTGATLYAQEFNFDCDNTGVTSFTMNKQTGGLSYLGVDNTGAFPGMYNPAYFTGNNLYAYSAANSSCMYYEIYGFKRDSNGLLVSAGGVSNSPEPPPDGARGYVPDLLAADPVDHFAVLEQPANPPACAPGHLQLATYTANSSGMLSTTSTYANMPATLIANPYDMKMSPSGKLVAVAGKEGLEVFHFNGAKPITHFTGLLTTEPINQMFWDKNNHLYAISQTAGKIYVFTITPGDAHKVPGSPYSINSPESLIVRSVVP